MELVHVDPELNIYDEHWPIWTYQRQYPPAKFVLDEEGRRGHGGELDGVGRLHHLRRARQPSRCCSPTCASTSAATSSASVIFPDVRVGAGSVIKRAIVDTGASCRRARRSASTPRTTRDASI